MNLRRIEDLLTAGHPNLSLETLITWTCPGCAFTMDACHEDSIGTGWTCPVCNFHESQDVATVQPKATNAAIDTSGRDGRQADRPPAAFSTNDEAD